MITFKTPNTTIEYKIGDAKKSLTYNGDIFRIAFKYCDSLFIPNIGSSSSNDRHLAQFLEFLTSNGFTLSSEAIVRIRDEHQSEVVNNIKAIYAYGLGIDEKQYRAFHGSFNIIREENVPYLFVTALLHYATCGNWEPEEDQYMSQFHIDLKHLKVLSLIDDEGLVDLWKKMLGTRTSMSKEMYNDLKILTNYLFDIRLAEYEIFNNKIDIPFKETLINFTAMILERPDIKLFNKYGEILCPNILSKYNNFTDILRLYAKLSDGDETLTERTHFKSLSKKKKELFGLLIVRWALISTSEGLISEYKEEWKRVFQRLHPGSKKFWDTTCLNQVQQDVLKNVYDHLYNNTTPYDQSYKGCLAELAKELIEYNKKPFDDNNYTGIEFSEKCKVYDNFVDLYATKPGEFMRSLDFILRIAPKSPFDKFRDGTRNHVTNTLYSTVVKEVPTPLIITLLNRFKKIDELDKYDRVICFKGKKQRYVNLSDYGKNYGERDYSPFLVNNICHILKNELINRYKKIDLGWNRVYLDPLYKNIKIPNNMRTLDDTKKIIPRFSSIPLTDSDGNYYNYIRPFIWWTNTENNTCIDIDLDVSIIKADGSDRTSFNYYGLTDSDHTIVHSGDFVNGGPFGGKGVAEFVNINLDAVRKKYPDHRYIMVNVFVFRGFPFSQLNCEAGFMGITEEQMCEKRPLIYNCNTAAMSKYIAEHPIVVPELVDFKMNLTTESTHVIPFIIDIVENKMIITDISSMKTTNLSNADRSSNTIQNLLKYTIASEAIQPNLYDLICTYAEAHHVPVQISNSTDTDKKFIQDADTRFVFRNTDQYTRGKTYTPFDFFEFTKLLN